MFCVVGLAPAGAPTPSTAAHTTATPTGAQLERFVYCPLACV